MEVKNLKPRGFIFDWKKFDVLRDNLWENAEESGTMKRCRLHNTLFDSADEPCWQCHSMCNKEIT